MPCGSDTIGWVFHSFGARLLECELLPGTSLLMVQQSYSFQLSNYDLIFADKYLNTWTTVKSN